MKGTTDELQAARRDGEKRTRVDVCSGGDEEKSGPVEKWSGLEGELGVAGRPAGPEGWCRSADGAGDTQLLSSGVALQF